MADKFNSIYRDHILQHIVNHHIDWGRKIAEKDTREERFKAAKKLVVMAVRETKDPYMNSEYERNTVAWQLYFKAKREGYFI